MENPATWGRAEHVIHRAITEWFEGRDQGVVGLSQTRFIADALRNEGLLVREAAKSVHVSPVKKKGW